MEKMPNLPADPKDVIEHIRRYEFGVGASLEGDGLVVVENMRRRYRNLLATIAEDLNSKDSHFVLELVQNAEDNSYADGVAPSLSFIAERDRLIVINNEIGFLRENVVALCSAGESSKKNKTGYIGEKGIGFKSVFKVTDAPEVHSNGFHFQFNRSDPADLLGYVVPHWKNPEFSVDSGVTTLVLPARHGRHFSHELLKDLDATLLLFLEKLRRIGITWSSSVVQYMRNDDGPITTLTTTNAASHRPVEESRRRFFRTATKYDMSDLHEPKREGITETELVLAFPLSDEGEAAPDLGSSTYAFLPIRAFGFPFCIQADFVLISSREGVHEDLEWNITLRDEIAAAFVEAVEAFKSLPRLANTYLRFLPEANAVHDPFFQIVVDQVVEALAEVDCVPVEGGQWRTPKQIIIASDDERDLFSPQDAIELFGAEYPSKDFKAKPGQLGRIGCRTLLPSDVVRIFTEHTSWLASKSTEWKAKLFAYLASDRATYVVLLKIVPCLPVAGDRFSSPQSGPVFYPLSAGEKYEFEHELTILDEDIYKAALAISPEVTALFQDLGVKLDNPYELIRGHIFRQHARTKLDSNRQALIGHVRYIRDKLDVYLEMAANTGQSEKDALIALKSGLWIGTNKKSEESWTFNRPSELYLGKDYCPVFDIDTLLGDKLDPVHLVSDAYLGKVRTITNVETTEQELERWRRFFYRIGVNESPRLTGEAHTVACSPELKALLESGESRIRRAALECLDRYWHKYESSLKYSYTRYRQQHSQETPFRNQLRETKAPSKHHTTARLPETYLDNESVKNTLGGSIVFVDADLKNEKFLDATGITHKVNAAACIKRLEQIRDSEDRATLDQVRPIYRQLELLWPAERIAIENAFNNRPLILLTQGDRETWGFPRDACWKSTGVKLLDTQYPPLRTLYQEHQTFFTKQLAVPEELSLTKWVDALTALSDIEDSQERQNSALRIYQRLSKKLGSQPETESNWFQRFAVEPLYLDHHGRLVSKSNALYADDDPSYAVLFEDDPTISFLAVAREQLPSIANLLKHTEIARISSAVDTQATTETIGETDQDLTQRVRAFFGHIARMVYSQSPELFEAAVKEGLFEQLRKLEIQRVHSLEVVVSLGSLSRTKAGDAAPKGNQLLLRADAPLPVYHLAKEVSRILRLPQAQEASLGNMLRSTNVREADDYLYLERISQLPAEAQALLDGVEIDQFDDAVAEETITASATPERLLPPEHPVSGALSDDNSHERFTGTVIPLPVPPAPSHPQDSPRLPKDLITGAAPTMSDSVVQPMATIVTAPISPSSPLVQIDGDVPTLTHPPVRLPLAMTPPSSGRRTHKGTASSRSFERTKTGRLLSYVETSDHEKDGFSDKGDSDPEIAKRKKFIEEAAISHFLAIAAGQWKQVRVMENPNNPGFDISAIAFDGSEEFIEVKGQSGAWTESGVTVTPNELLKASEERERYWLCVVEYATDPRRQQLYLINNPFGLANQFRFDSGWKGKAAILAAKPTRPAKDLFVSIAGEGKARILAVRGNAKLVKLDLQFVDGRKRFNKLFEPNTMPLSVD